MAAAVQHMRRAFVVGGSITKFIGARHPDFISPYVVRNDAFCWPRTPHFHPWMALCGRVHVPKHVVVHWMDGWLMCQTLVQRPDPQPSGGCELRKTLSVCVCVCVRVRALRSLAVEF
jgi:hypothetical protein